MHGVAGLGLRAEGYVVDVAGTGEDGLWKARETAHDVIILDVMLPGIDGYQIARRLCEQGRWTPILMLTAMDEDLDHAEGLDSGADDYLAKPFSYPARSPPQGASVWHPSTAISLSSRPVNWP